MTYNVFISYSHKDKPIADAVCANIESAGMRCWIAPRDIAPGLDWPTAISEALVKCQVMVLIFSSHSNSSSDVGRELILAANNNLVIVPFRLDDITPEPGKQYYLARTHWLDAMNPPTQEQIDKLVASVRAFLVEKKVELASTKGTAAGGKKPLPRIKGTSRNSRWVWITLLSLLAVAVLVSGALFLPKLTSPPQSTPSPSPSLTSSPTSEPTSEPTPTITPLPGWVTDFAQPILDYTSTHYSSISAHPDQGLWSYTWLFDITTPLDPRYFSYAEEDGLKLNGGGGRGVDWKVWYTDFVIEMDIKFPQYEDGVVFYFRDWQWIGIDYAGDISLTQPDNQIPIPITVPRDTWNTADFNHITIIVSDYSAAIYVNGQPMLFGDLTNVKSGEGSFGGVVSIRGIAIWDLGDR